MIQPLLQRSTDLQPPAPTDESEGGDRPTCPLSGNSMEPWLNIPCDYRKPVPKHSYRLYWSDLSQFGQLFPRPTLEDIRAFYDLPSYYTHQLRPESTLPAHATFTERLLRHIAWRADNGRDLSWATLVRLRQQGSQRFCDLGCGGGDLATEAINAGFSEVVGIEPDAEARRVAQARGIKVLHGTAEALPDEVERGHFDTVCMSHVLEHTLDPVGAVKNVASLLVDGGTAIIETPNHSAFGCRLSGPYWPWLDVPRHLNFFTPASLRRTCMLAGLQPVRTEFTGYCRQFSRHWRAVENSIYDAFHEHGRLRTRRWPASRTVLGQWFLLARTFANRARHKYDSVRITAVKRNEPVIP